MSTLLSGLIHSICGKENHKFRKSVWPSVAGEDEINSLKLWGLPGVEFIYLVVFLLKAVIFLTHPQLVKTFISPNSFEELHFKMRYTSFGGKVKSTGSKKSVVKTK